MVRNAGGPRAGNLRRSGDEAARPVVGRGLSGWGRLSTADSHFGLRLVPHHHRKLYTSRQTFARGFGLASASKASQRQLAFQDGMGAAVRNDTVPETGLGASCSTGECVTPIRRIPRLDRVMPVAGRERIWD